MIVHLLSFVIDCVHFEVIVQRKSHFGAISPKCWQLINSISFQGTLTGLMEVDKSMLMDVH